MKKNNKIIIIMYFSIIFVFDLLFFNKFIRFAFIEKNIPFSYFENRRYHAFEEFLDISIDRIINTTELQENFEESIGDLSPLSKKIRLVFNSEFKFLKYGNLNKKLCDNHYVRVNNYYVTYNCDSRLMPDYNDLNTHIKEIEKKLKLYDSINKNVDTYYYYINSSRSYDFENNRTIIDVEKKMKDTFKNNYTYSELKINDYSDYQKYFYKTDHHWNYEGGYQAYKDIINMMTNDSLRKPIKLSTFKGSNFFGTLAIESSNYEFREVFKAYQFDIPEYKKTVYGSWVEPPHYTKKYYTTSEYLYQYYSYYGDDYSLAIYDYNQSDKDNILIISNSFSNSVREIISSHFNKTHILNLNKYRDDIGNDFDIKSYVLENDIDKVLVLADFWFLIEEKFDIEWS